MARDLYVYDVFDKDADTYILEDAPMKEVMTNLKIDKSRVINAVKEGHTVGGRYTISRTYLDGTKNPGDAEEKNENKQTTISAGVNIIVPEELAREWDTVRFFLNPKARVVK